MRNAASARVFMNSVTRLVPGTVVRHDAGNYAEGLLDLAFLNRPASVHDLGCGAAEEPDRLRLSSGVDRSLHSSLCHCEQSNGRHCLPGP
jgi:hypothetical protein